MNLLDKFLLHFWWRANKKINAKLDHIMATQAELAQTLNGLTTQVAKIATESTKSLQLITDLQAQIAAGDTVSTELQASVDALAAQIKTTDDLIPDAPATPAAKV